MYLYLYLYLVTVTWRTDFACAAEASGGSGRRATPFDDEFGGLRQRLPHHLRSTSQSSLMRGGHHALASPVPGTM